jgi:hypothetical protein
MNVSKLPPRNGLALDCLSIAISTIQKVSQDLDVLPSDGFGWFLVSNESVEPKRCFHSYCLNESLA